MTPTPPDMPELKSCPFCGSQARLAKIGNGGECAYCANEDCNVQPELKGYLDPVDAIAAWNTRPTPPADAMVREEQELAEENKMMKDQWRKIFHAEQSGSLDDEIKKAISFAEERPIKSAEDFSSNALLIEAATRYLEASDLHPPAPVTDAQREASEPRAYLHTCESGSSLFHTRVSAEQKMRQWGGQVVPLYAALSAPVAQVDVASLKHRCKEELISPVCPRGEVTLAFEGMIGATVDFITTRYHLTPKTPEGE